LIGTHVPLVPGLTQATGHDCDVHPAAFHCATIGSSALVSFTQPWQLHVNDVTTRCVHCAVPALELHMRACMSAVA
jgi:hypothetical protein